MIVDELHLAERYGAQSPQLQAAFDFLQSLSGSIPPDWEDGPRELSLGVVAVIARGECRTKADLEVHNRFIDVHCLFKGEETIGWHPRSQCSCVSVPFDTGKDVGFYAETPQIMLPLSPGQFAVFYPEDAHMPMMGDGFVEKIIMKVPV